MNDLIRGIMVVIGIAIVTGHYGDLQRFARREAMKAMLWKEPLPYFFSPARTHRAAYGQAVTHHREQ